MKSLGTHLAQYAAYHRDRRNILTHFVGIPLIVLAVAILASRPAWAWGPVMLSPALVLVVLSCLFYLRLALGLGLVMTALMLLALWAGQGVATWSTGPWLATGLGLFVVGWVFQFVGHYYEGRKPAFVDDLVGLIIGPLFVVAEAAFLLGLLPTLKAEVEASAGPVH